MHIHFLGIAGTFMASLALLAKELGFTVTGQDQNIYPPMSEQLFSAKIKVINGYAVNDLPSNVDLIIIGNVMTRGTPIIEHILNTKLRFCSGPAFLSEFILKQKHVLVVSGTHGKTTTTSMLTWILERAGLDPGYLIGGVAKNFPVSARIGKGQFFVIEGDEYDCAFFDKRSKFMHYQPKTLIINNIDFDHADLFANINEIIKQFHHLVRIVPGNGTIIFKQQDRNIKKLLNMGVWSNLIGFNINNATKTDQHGTTKLINLLKRDLADLGEHNLNNAMAACLAAATVGIELEFAVHALTNFQGVVRRMDYIGCYHGVEIYDDFAHHPTAIAATIKAFKQNIFDPKLNNSIAKNYNNIPKLIVVLDLGSNTLKMGINNQKLVVALQLADQVYLFAEPNKITWNLADLFNHINKPGSICYSIEALLEILPNSVKTGDHLLFMSNGKLANVAYQLSQLL